jgi:hypothetical protein
MEASLGAEIQSAFKDLRIKWFPSGYEDYYSVDTKVILEIRDENNDLIHTDSKDLTILMETSKNLQFKWTPEKAGEYKAVIKTRVTDCQCSSTLEQSKSKEFSVAEDFPDDSCYTLIKDLHALPESPEVNEKVTITFNKISNYLNKDKTPVQTKAFYEITKGSEVVYSDELILEANPNSADPQSFSFDWTPTETGEYQIKVSGVAENSLCTGKENPLGAAILGLSVGIKDQHTLTFEVYDFDSWEPLENALVKVGSREVLTDSKGRAPFTLNEGRHNWEISKPGYETRTNSINVDRDKTKVIGLKKLVLEKHDLKFIVTDTQGNFLENVLIEIDSFSEKTDSSGEALFELDEGSYNWQASLTDYITKTGSVELDEDKTINIILAMENESITEVEILFPTAGAILKKTEEILWNASNSLNHELLIDISYSRDNGSTWVEIITGTSNNGVHSWNTKNYPNDEYILKVCALDQVDGEVTCDVSDEFTINNKEDDDEDDNDKRNKKSLDDSELCFELWECSGWSECTDGMQTRTCTDLNHCKTQLQKPAEKRACLNDVQELSVVEEPEQTNLTWFIIALIILIVLLVVLIILLR